MYIYIFVKQILLKWSNHFKRIMSYIEFFIILYYNIYLIINYHYSI